MCLLVPPVLAFIVHLPALSASLFWDDGALIVSHPRIADPAFIKEIFSRDYGLELQLRAPIGYYRPLLLVVDYGLFQLFGPSAGAYHVAVLLTFCFSCFLLTAVAMRALGEQRRGVALAIGCIAAVHPVRTEFAVFFMSMPDIMIEIFILLMIANCLGFLGPWPTTLRALIAGVLALAAGLTKETSFLMIGAMGAALLVWGLYSSARRDPLLQALGWTLGLVAAFGFRFAGGVAMPFALRPDASVLVPLGNPSLPTLSVGSSRAVAGLAGSIGHLMVPSKTVFMSVIPDTPVFAALGIGVAGFGVAAAFAFWLIRRQRLFEALVGAWLAAGFASLMLLCARDYPFADRYIPSGAAILALVMVTDYFWRRWRGDPGGGRWIPAVALVVYLGALATFAWESTVRCRGIRAFFAAMADDNPSYYFPRVVLANIMLLQDDNSELAAKYMNEAIALAPDDPKVRSLGKSLAARYIAEAEYQKGLEALDWSEQVLLKDAEIWSMRATCQTGLLDYAGALGSAQRARELAPNHPDYVRQMEEIKQAAAGE